MLGTVRPSRGEEPLGDEEEPPRNAEVARARWLSQTVGVYERVRNLQHLKEPEEGA
jgi:hypothetical protein